MSSLSPVWYSCRQSLEYQRDLYGFEMSFPEEFDLFRLIELECKERDAAEQEKWDCLIGKSIDIKNTYLKYETLPVQQLPTRMYTFYKEQDLQDLHSKFQGFFVINNGYKLLTEACYQLIQQFRLGPGTEFIPIRLYHYHTKQAVNEETYYLLSLTDWRSYLLPDFCKGRVIDRERLKGGVPAYRLGSGQEFDDAIALSSVAQQCDLDLWHDPALQDSLFMSDGLKQALEQAEFLVHWDILSTELIYKQ